MNLLLDECVPRLRKGRLEVEGHFCLTVPEAGFAGKSNGELLKLAEGEFQVFITLDKGLPHQQNLSGLSTAIRIIRSKSNRRVDVLPFAPAVLGALRNVKAGEVRTLEKP